MLFIVSTPIGNLSDITYRAVDVLKSVDLIACEDTRHSRILLEAYGIRKPLCSYYEYNKLARGEYLLKLLKENKAVALISDAGTPGISDPGFSLVRSALEAGIRVVSIPGPTALISALSVSGLPTNRFFFEGFLPVKTAARKKRLKDLGLLGVTVVVYESPHRILSALQDMALIFGERPIVLARELTKKFEEILRGTPEQLLDRMKQGKPKGEFVVVF